MTGYVDLSASQVFTTEHIIMVTPAPLPARASGVHTPASSIGQTQNMATATATATATFTPVAVKLAVGPRVTGVVTVLTDGITLTLLSDQFPLKTSTGLNLLRQFSLVGRKVAGNGSASEAESGAAPQTAEENPCPDTNVCTADSNSYRGADRDPDASRRRLDQRRVRRRVP